VAAKNDNDPPPLFHDQSVHYLTSAKTTVCVEKGWMPMIGTLSRAAARWTLMVTVGIAVATSAYSQAPTDAQRSAIRAECRSDYQAHCASIPPGGMASLQCLQKNMSSLSSGCQSAVRAVGTPSETKAEPSTTPAKTESGPAAAPKEESAAAPARPAAEAAAPVAPKAATSSKPSSANIAAIRSACRSDYSRVCAGVPTGGAPALQCLEKNKSRVSAACQKAVAAVGGSAAPPTAGGAAAPATEATASPASGPAAAVLVLRPMRPREEMFVLRSACGADVRALCAGVAPGGGRLMQCLAAQSASLSPDCRGVLSEFAAQ
jgi:hypothetical protein